ncbi:putative signal peptide protein [Puccinia sorghi]|uniref:Putative signal peptide protein n=1 Tax=Puccinia sorghi TaxID=27349 RepID=A0A0L6UAH7_9BASI|nr:putative signal peptide protein [Puccinia sorghi]
MPKCQFFPSNGTPYHLALIVDLLRLCQTQFSVVYQLPLSSWPQQQCKIEAPDELFPLSLVSN